MPTLDFESERVAFRDYYNDNIHRLNQASEVLLTLLISLLASGDYTVAASTTRIKDREESIKKFTRKYQNDLEASATPYEIKDHITDLIGLRLVVLYEDEIEPIGGLIRKHFEVIEVTDKTAQLEDTENSFGYKGLHLDLKLNAERAAMPEYMLYASFRFELQIRTIVQDSWSTLDHKIKYKKSIPASLKRRINTLAALFELADREFRQVRDQTELQIERAKSEPKTDGEGPKNPPFSSDNNNTNDESVAFVPLDSFRLLLIAGSFFPSVEFEPAKIDGFTSEVIEREPNISRWKFNNYLRSKISFVRQYKSHFLKNHKNEPFNAFTEMRHALYAANPDIFASMLTNVAREAFDAWRQENEPNRE